MGFIKDFLFLNFNQYENIAINFPVGAVILFLAVSASLLAFYLHFAGSKSYSMYKQLFRHEAFDEGSAKTLSELRLDTSRLLRFLLSSKGELTRLVKRVGEKKLTYEEYIASAKKKEKEEKINFSEARFYICAEGKEKAKSILATSPPSIYKPIFVTAVFALILVLSVLFLPDLLAAINNSVG